MCLFFFVEFQKVAFCKTLGKHCSAKSKFENCTIVNTPGYPKKNVKLNPTCVFAQRQREVTYRPAMQFTS